MIAFVCLFFSWVGLVGRAGAESRPIAFAYWARDWSKFWTMEWRVSLLSGMFDVCFVARGKNNLVWSLGANHERMMSSVMSSGVCF